MRQLEAPKSRFITRAKKFLSALPLAATLLTGCGETKDECTTYNDTTITLNRATDGKSASVKDLEAIAPGGFLEDKEIDFINETHVLSSQSMPEDVKVTQVADTCTHNGRLNGYSQPVASFGVDKGVYLPDGMGLDAISLIGLTDHEVGHLMGEDPPGTFEVISQLNEYEQNLMGFVLLSSQNADTGELLRWQSHSVHPSLFRRLVLTIGSGRDLTDYDIYDKSNMHIYNRLVDLQGGFRLIRDEVAEIVQKTGLQDVLDNAPAVFLSNYTTEADMFIAIRMQLLSEIQRRFGLGLSYFNANSNLLDAGLALGLDGLNCAFVDPPASATYSPCSDATCGNLGADSSHPVDYNLCCIGMEGSGFTKYSVNASGMKYSKSGGNIQMYDFTWDSVIILTPSKQEISIGKTCG